MAKYNFRLTVIAIKFNHKIISNAFNYKLITMLRGKTALGLRLRVAEPRMDTEVLYKQFEQQEIADVKSPIHDSDLQSQPRFPTATSSKFPVYGLQQPQPPPWLAGRCCCCCWSEFSDIWWAELKVAVEVAVVYGQKRSNMSHKRRYLHAFELVHWYKWNFPGQTGSEIFTMQFGYWL